MTAQFIRFVLAGGTSVVANYSSRFLFSLWVSYPLAIIFAYLVGMVVAFILMRALVFSPNSHSLSAQIIKFSLVNVVSLLQTLVVSLLLAWWVLPELGIIENAEALGHLGGMASTVIVSFYLHKKHTFR